jgi:hypothetical protein
MNQAQEMNTFDQENNGILENQYYENFEWLHKQDSILENLLRQKQESTWIRNHQNQSLNQDTEFRKRTFQVARTIILRPATKKWYPIQT